MSKERELLKQIQQFLLCECEDTYGFAKDIQELLAQPEQEPVAWKWEEREYDPYSEEYREDYTLFFGEDKPYPTDFVVNVQPLYLAQPEHLLLDEYDAGLLSDFGGGDVSWWQDYIRTELERAHDYYQSQLNKAISQPKQTEQEYGQLCDKSDFEMFASSIEKAHGITGVDDE